MDVFAKSDGERWYPVHTQPRGEMKAEAQLRNQGFQTYLPRRTKTIRHARRLSNVVAPFFPRYLFVKMDTARDRWRSINGTYGVSSLVMSGAQPLAVPHGIVEDFIALTDCDGLLRAHSRLRTGEMVKLLCGPFAELIGELQDFDDDGRVKVLLQLMGMHVPVWSTAKSVVPA